jgi:hypothetical protein
MDKKFEKLDFEILNSGLDGDVIPTVESFDSPKPEAPVVPGNADDAPDDTDALDEVTSITDLEKDPDLEEPITQVSTDPEDTESEAKGLAKYFSSKGFLEYSEDEFQDDEDWVETKVIETLTKRAEDSLDPQIRYINDLYKKGVSLETLIKAEVEREKLEDIDDTKLQEDDALAESVVRNYLSTVLEQDEEDIEETINTFKDASILNKEAIKAKPKILKFNEKRIAAEKRQAELERQEMANQEKERMAILKKVVDTTPEFIKGVPIADAEKSKLYEGITKKDRQGLTDYQKKLMDPEMQMKVAQFVLLLDGDASKLSEKIKTKVTSDMKKQTNSYKEKGKPDPKKDAAAALEFIKKYAKK